MARAGIWALGSVVSAVAHLAAGAGLMAALQPQDIPDQTNPKSRLQVTPEVVQRKDAREQTPDSTDVSGAQTSGAALGAGAVQTLDAIATAIPSARAAAANPTVTETGAVPVAGARLSAAPNNIQPTLPITPQGPAEPPKTLNAAIATPSEPETASMVSLAPAAVTAQPAPARVTSAAASLPVTISALTATPAASTAPSIAPIAPRASATRPASALASATQPDTAKALAAPVDATLASATVPDAAAAFGGIPDATPAPLQAPVPVALSQSTPDMTATKAVLAFPGAGTGPVDPASLAAFQSFTQPGEAGADRVRDDLAALLSLPCARMQVNFDPETASLQLSGHVPSPDQRAPTVAALQAQMGSDIVVTDNLLVLPAPQCGALSGIANVGLPQSTDQITNPLIVGKDTHARSFRYIKNDPMVLELVGPDYPAYVYVDYFDADGNVIHLSPNAQTPLVFANPEEQISIGARRPGDPGLMVVIGPPYGQEIAVAFAASAPLYDEQRPIIEPAQPYLEWLEVQVARARAADPEFKGEWVYFFVQTAEQ